MLVRCIVGASAVALSALVAVPVAATSTPASSTAAAECGTGSWTAGQVDLCAGTLVYRDYVYDDYGADNGRPGIGSTTGRYSTPAGDVRYATEDVNTADLVALRMRVDGDRLLVQAEMNALHRADSTVLAFTIDTDNDASTGGGAWDGLGVTSAGWDVLETFDVGDPSTNLIEGSLPLPAGDTWRVQAVTAQAGGPVMNVAFRGTDERANATLGTQPLGGEGVWFEDRQASALRTGDISEFGHTVDVADLTGGVTREAVVGPGLHERVYVSDHTLPPGEGMSYTPIKGRGTGGVATAFAQNFHYFGKYQPYGIYVPEAAGPHGVQLVFHGSNANHATLINQPGMQLQIGEELNRLLVVPLSRGPNGYGSDISERDELDVLADVEANFPVDAERIFTGGYSQGGYAAYRFAMLYPDRIAGTISWVGFTGDAGNGTPAGGQGLVTAGAIGNMIDFVGNARHIPTAMVYGGIDELVHVSSSRAMGDAFAGRQDYPYAFYLHPTADHFAFALLDEWSKEAEFTRDLRLVRDPARVTFRTDPNLGNAEYGISHDRAYWTSEIRGREEGHQDLDLTSAGCGGPVPTTTASNSSGTEPLPWAADLRTVTGTQALDRDNRVEGTLANVSSLRIDTEPTCLTPAPLAYDLTTDGPATLAFSDGRVLTLPVAGQFAGVLTGRSAVAGPPAAGPVSAAQPGQATAPSADLGSATVSAPDTRTGRLAATGLAQSSPVLAVLALLAGLVLDRRRRRPVTSHGEPGATLV